jgi:hypothetical protein
MEYRQVTDGIGDISQREIMNRSAFLYLTLYFLAVSAGFAQNDDTFFQPAEKDLNTSLIICIDPLTRTGIDSVLNTHIFHLTREGYHVLLHQTTEDDPISLRSYLRDQHESLEPVPAGVIFIGSFPKAFSLVEHPEYGITPFLSMEYYQDLDGTYERAQLESVQYAFANHSGAVESEVWTSVIPLIGAPGSDSALAKIRGYFSKNFAYRRKRKTEVQRGHAEPIIGYSSKDVWQTQIDVYIKELNFDLRSGNLTITRDNSRSDDPRFPDAKFTFEQELLTGWFDFAKVGGHGSYYYFTHTEPSISITMQWADSVAVQPLYMFDGSCNTGEFHTHDNGCVATSFLYNPDNNVVVYTAATNYSYGGYTNAEGTWRNVLIANLEKGMSFGDALLYNFRQQPVNLNGRDRDAYTAPRILFGDGTLKLQEHMDYEGNNPPYVLGQRQVVMPVNGSYTLTPEDVIVSDNDSDVGEMTIITSDGKHYSITDDRIVPEKDFQGFLVIPVVLNDGSEKSPPFQMVAFVDSTDEPAVCAEGEAGTIIEQLRSTIPPLIERDLPGRLYFFPEQIDTVINETFDEIRFSIPVRGTETGETVYQKTIIEKKEGYVAVDGEKDKDIPRQSLVSIRNGSLMLAQNSLYDTVLPLSFVLFNLRGEIVEKWQWTRWTDSKRNVHEVAALPKGTYILWITDVQKNTTTVPCIIIYRR